MFPVILKNLGPEYTVARLWRIAEGDALTFSAAFQNGVRVEASYVISTLVLYSDVMMKNPSLMEFRKKFIATPYKTERHAYISRGLFKGIVSRD